MSQMQAVGSSSNSVALNDGVSSSIKATVFDYATSNPMATTLVDTNGDPVSVGGGTQYTEDAAAAANPVGTAVNLIRQDTPSALVTTDGDNVAQRGTNYGAAYTQIVSSTGAFIDTFGGGTQYTEGDVDATPTGTVAMGQQISTDTMRPIAVTAEGYVQISTTASVPIDDNGGSITVDAVALDVRPLTFATDTADVSGSTVTANAGTDLNTSALALETGGNLAAIAASASVLDDWDETNRAAVNIIAGQVGVAGGTGLDGETVQRVSLATDVPLPVGNNNIGNVDIASISGTVSTVNSSTATLLSGAVFTGTAEDVLNYASICVSIFSNVASATDGIQIQFSSDGTNWDCSYTYTLTAGSGRTYKAGVEARYFRVVYTNGGTNQTTFRLQTIFSPVATKQLSAPVEQIIQASDNAQLVKAVLTGVTTAGGGAYVDVKVSPSGTVQVGGTVDAVTEITNALPTGTNAIGRVGHDITGIGHGVTTVTTAGTDVALAASTACKRVVITAQTDNTNIIAVGGAGVDATVATGTGVPLSPGDSFELEIDNLADVYVDALVSGEGVRYVYFT